MTPWLSLPDRRASINLVSRFLSSAKDRSTGQRCRATSFVSQATNSRYFALVCRVDVPGKNVLEKVSRMLPMPSSSTVDESSKSLTTSSMAPRWLSSPSSQPKVDAIKPPESWRGLRCWPPLRVSQQARRESSKAGSTPDTNEYGRECVPPSQRLSGSATGGSLSGVHDRSSGLDGLMELSSATCATRSVTSP